MLNRVRAGLYKQPFTLTFTPTVMFVGRGRTRKNQQEPTQTRRKHASATLVESPTFFLRNGAFSCHFSTLVIKIRPSITVEQKQQKYSGRVLLPLLMSWYSSHSCLWTCLLGYQMVHDSWKPYTASCTKWFPKSLRMETKSLR